MIWFDLIWLPLLNNKIQPRSVVNIKEGVFIVAELEKCPWWLTSKENIQVRVVVIRLVTLPDCLTVWHLLPAPMSSEKANFANKLNVYLPSSSSYLPRAVCGQCCGTSRDAWLATNGLEEPLTGSCQNQPNSHFESAAKRPDYKTWPLGEEEKITIFNLPSVFFSLLALACLKYYAYNEGSSMLVLSSFVGFYYQLSSVCFTCLAFFCWWVYWK